MPHSRTRQRRKGLVSTLSLWPTRCHSRMATSRGSTPLYLAKSARCSTLLDAAEAMKVSAKGCGLNVPTQLQNWPTLRPLPTRIPLIFNFLRMSDSATSKSYCHDGESHPILCHDTFTGGLILFKPLIHSAYP